MIKNMFGGMDTEILAEISLFAFVFVFALILLRVFTLSKTEVEDSRQIPLNEPKETYQD